MADVFISYSRADRAKIEQLVVALEAGGYSIWWDRQISGGATFSRVIEAELQAADAVVVLWSQNSILSDWVKDEAEIARNDGKLLPLAIDGVLPPIGYRQIHALDFDGWDGDPQEEHFQDLLNSLGRAIAGGENHKRITSTNDNMHGAKSQKPAIAVLPFVNMSDDMEKEYFADGMTEDIITGLSLSRHISVISRTSTFGYKGQSPDIRELGRALGVNYIVEGSVRPIGPRIRITVQFIEAQTGNHVWAEKFDRLAADIFDIQDEVIDNITCALGANLTKAETRRARALKPKGLSAWEAVQRALILHNFRSSFAEDLETSIDELRRAVGREPDYAYAHSTLAWLLNMRILNGMSPDRDADCKASDEHLERGLALGGDDPFNLDLCARKLQYASRYEEALELCQRALGINPNYADVFFRMGNIYTFLGRYEEAEAALDQVEKSAPAGVFSSNYSWYRAMLRSFEGRHDEAEKLLRDAIIRMPKFAVLYVFLAVSLAALGREDEARTAITQAVKVDPNVTLERMSMMIGQSHPDDEEGARRMEVLRGLWG